jgi:hypothetical protein
MLCVEPCPEATLGALRTSRVVTLPDAAHGYRVKQDSRPLGEVWGCLGSSPVLKIWAGMEPAVRHLLQRTGHAIKSLGTIRPPLPSPDLQALQGAPGDEPPLLDLVRTRDRALIRLGPGPVSPVRVVAQIARGWPDLTITLAVATHEDSYNLRDALLKFVPDVQAYHSDCHPEFGARLAVATFDSLEHPPIWVGERDIVVVLDAHEAAAKRAPDLLARAGKARLYGLLWQQDHLSPYERDIVTALFGFEELTIPSPGCREREVRVVRCPIQGGPPAPAESDLVPVLEWGIRTHQLRNRRIARLAALLKDGPAAELHACVPDVAKALSSVPNPRVVVLVDLVQHGLALAQRLPGWPLVVAPDADLDGLNTEQVQVVEATAGYVVVTSSGLRHLDLREVDVLIRADGGAGLPALPDRRLIESHKLPPRPLLLVDFEDRHHPLLLQRSRQRAHAYWQRGWFPAGVDPVQGRVARFLAVPGRCCT